ncbi:c-type cytochrome [Paracoccus sp. S-4012]|nr:c-type cytochrome [Paracoccus sp. S-4012]
MSKFRNAVSLLVLLAASPAAAQSDGSPVPAAPSAEAKASAPLGIGRTALPEEIAAWDKDISPDGLGLPEGSGDVASGEALFTDYCASCHGDFAEGLDNWPALAGGEGTLDHDDPEKTIGSYWPYLSTVWDYVHRSMPFGNAQSLTADETYAITAYILYSNYLVEDDFTLSHTNFGEVELPNAGGFVEDDRAETEYPIFAGEPCMENCKDAVEITKHASVLDVTPEDGSDAPEGAEGM